MSAANSSSIATRAKTHQLVAHNLPCALADTQEPPPQQPTRTEPGTHGAPEPQ